MDETTQRIYTVLKNSRTHKVYAERMDFLDIMSKRQSTAKLKKMAAYLADHPFADWSISYAGCFGLTMPSGFKPTDPLAEY